LVLTIIMRLSVCRYGTWYEQTGTIMNYGEKIIIKGTEDGHRVESRVLEERIQSALAGGCRSIEVHAFGQHGIGGRLLAEDSAPVQIDIHGYAGQRVGSMGFAGTRIDVHGQASDDVGWLNAGATIMVHGDATNGVANAMAQGKVCVAGDIGSRGMTMTKSNPRFCPPELWVLGGAGDSFAEFMAGGIAVVCGFESQYRGNILGHRPCVGMVGGRIFFRGRQENFSSADARLVKITDEDWQWLCSGIKEFLEAIGRTDVFKTLTADRSAWKLLKALEPFERSGRKHMPLSHYRRNVWERELGEGGLIGDLTDIDRSPVPVITTGDLRRFAPVWENHKYLPPCQVGCPTGIPVQQRWELIRNGELDRAAALALEHTPFPATVCGYLCPNLCMQNCTRTRERMAAIDVTVLGRASRNAADPQPAPAINNRVAVIGSGPAGLSVAWQLWMKGHDVEVFDRSERAGGKIASVIPESRFPREVFEEELQRVLRTVAFKQLPGQLDAERFAEIRDSHACTVIATGADKPRRLSIPGAERALDALAFLTDAKAGTVKVGARVVIIGAGNVGCDAATEAYRLGAVEVTLIDIRTPASFGKEREAAEKAGAGFLWPLTPSVISKKGVETQEGTFLDADTVIIAIGDVPDLAFLPGDIAVSNGYIAVDDQFQTTDARVYAVGDTVKPGLITEAIAAGKLVAAAIDARARGREQTFDRLPALDPNRVKLAYYSPELRPGDDPGACAAACASCGGCRDCGLCVTLCPQQAISRNELPAGGYEYAVDPESCIGCGFCAGACPCGIWALKENDPID
jgi:NADPH-dependent glutamate synthase beta subunit-like oxidoreductase/glutamate synthase domain-containing protein 3/NAD-dependent dihydropyrimidine dehydrogenase PreA subunit